MFGMSIPVNPKETRFIDSFRKTFGSKGRSPSSEVGTPTSSHRKSNGTPSSLSTVGEMDRLKMSPVSPKKGPLLTSSLDRKHKEKGG